MDNQTTKNNTKNFINREITITVGNKSRKAFLQSGFYDHHYCKNLNRQVLGIPHIHNYAEIHCFLGGKSDFILGGEVMTLDDSVAIIVPKKHYHISSSSPDVSHLAFQVDMPVDKFSFVKLPPDLLERVFSEIEEQGISGNHARIADYLSFIASNFYEYPFAPAEKTTDYSFVIQSFLSLKYNTNIHLSDIAEELHVSIKQAERLVLLHTGNTFNNELTKYRITAAEQLAKLNPGLTVGEIANLVGYESHSGFWKAYKRFKKEKDN